ncbi:MAG: histidine phosphatase family protein [Candidatus Brennerbacteria bacterium]|nr:histidine phosphatase family protein [Candidatus Brennerbacteria bacterium]
MKWPLSITLIRHGESEYNALKKKKAENVTYQRFKKEFEKDYTSPETLRLAKIIKEKFALKTNDYKTNLTDTGAEQSRAIGKYLKNAIPCPDVILVSPYYRTRYTLWRMREKWQELKNVAAFANDRIREQEHGLALLYNDRRVFQTFHPEQKTLYDLLGPYWYQYPQGESTAQVCDRARSITNTIIREYANKHVMIITHHLTILAIRANYERLTPEQFIELDEKEKPINCGITIYKGNPNAGENGKLELQCYNAKFY